MRSIDRLVATVLVASSLAGCGPAAAPVAPWTIPRVDNQSVAPLDGDQVGGPIQPSNMGGAPFAMFPPSTLLGNTPFGVAQGCLGNRVRVVAPDKSTVYGMLIVFRADPNGKGPAGRGDYLLKVPEDRIRAASGGRMSVAYESYTTTRGEERYAWVVWMSEQPFRCEHPVS